MSTGPEGQEAWQVSVHVDGAERGIARADLTRSEALLLANEMNATVYQLLVEQEWMPAIIAIAAPEGPGRKIFREIMKDLDDLEAIPVTREIQGATLDRVVGHWVRVEDGSGLSTAGLVVAGTTASPSILIENLRGDRLLQPLSSVTEVSDQVVDIEQLRGKR